MKGTTMRSHLGSLVRSTGQLGPAVRLMVVLTVLLGLAYPLALTGVGRALFPGRAEGSLVQRDGRTVGSTLIAQSYGGDPAYFRGRPSASDDDPRASGASNLALDSPLLLRQVRERRAAAARADGTAPADVAPDALLASGSGLDPQISPLYAAQQVDRVARVRGLPQAAVSALVARNTSGRTLGFLGEPRVDVLALNLALDGSSR